MKADVKEKYGVTLKRLGAIGFSAMMHGYMVFDKDGQLLVPFRTWRNSITEEASDELTSLLITTFLRDGALPIFIRQC